MKFVKQLISRLCWPFYFFSHVFTLFVRIRLAGWELRPVTFGYRSSISAYIWKFELWGKVTYGFTTSSLNDARDGVDPYIIPRIFRYGDWPTRSTSWWFQWRWRCWFRYRCRVCYRLGSGDMWNNGSHEWVYPSPFFLVSLEFGALDLEGLRW